MDAAGSEILFYDNLISLARICGIYFFFLALRVGPFHLPS